MLGEDSSPLSIIYIYVHITKGSQGSSSQYIVLSVDWVTGVRSPTEAEDFSSSFCIQTGSGAHPASCPVGTGGPFPGDKARLGRDTDHSPQSSAKVKNK
jgi:hypothetical protein